MLEIYSKLKILFIIRQKQTLLKLRANILHREGGTPVVVVDPFSEPAFASVVGGACGGGACAGGFGGLFVLS